MHRASMARIVIAQAWPSIFGSLVPLDVLVLEGIFAHKKLDMYVYTRKQLPRSHQKPDREEPGPPPVFPVTPADPRLPPTPVIIERESP